MKVSSRKAISDLDYADGIVLFEATEKNMTETTEGIRKAASNLGLVMSFKKTEIMQLIIIQIKKKREYKSGRLFKIFGSIQQF